MMLVSLRYDGMAVLLGVLNLSLDPASSLRSMFPSSRRLSHRRSQEPLAPFVSQPGHDASPRTPLVLHNLLRDYASFAFDNADYDDDTRSMNWRKNQGYASSSLEGLGGSIRDAETNPYYDPGWAQSIRRDDPNDPYDDWGGRRRSTFPGMTSPEKSLKWYTNPTNPYYDPLWSQSHVRYDEPIRERDASYGYDYPSFRTGRRANLHEFYPGYDDGYGRYQDELGSYYNGRYDYGYSNSRRPWNRDASMYGSMKYSSRHANDRGNRFMR